MSTINNKTNSDKKNFNFNNFLPKDSNLTRLLVIMVIVFLFVGLLKPGSFFTLDNFSSMAFQFPEFGIIAIGMMLTMLTGGIDLSLVSIANLSAILAAMMLTKVMPKDAAGGTLSIFILIAIAVAIAAGLLCGLVNGLLISKIGIPPMLATIGTQSLFAGIAVALTKGTAVFFPAEFANIGNSSIWIFPVPLVIFVVFAIIFSILLNRSSYGLKLYMMGTNAVSSKFSGVNNVAMTIRTYIYSGMLGAFAGLIVAARTSSAKADYGTSYTLQAVLVAVLGGVDPNGGFGKVVGIVMAMLTLQFLSSGINMMQITTYFKDFAWGAILIIVMAVNYIINTRNAKVKSKKA